ncbi:MAG TPA: hypothetical protein DC031_09950 [Sulfitobacter sp.]|nr:hypothetical protein [Sulfitobacter sp.]
MATQPAFAYALMMLASSQLVLALVAAQQRQARLWFLWRLQRALRPLLPQLLLNNFFTEA